MEKKEKWLEARKYSYTEEWKKKISINKTKDREIIKTKCVYCNSIFEQEIIKGNKPKRILCSSSCCSKYANSFPKKLNDESQRRRAEKIKQYSNSIEGKESKRKAANISVKNKALKIL